MGKKLLFSMMMLVLVVPMSFMLTACGSTAEQLYLERVPMLTIPEGEYKLEYCFINDEEVNVEFYWQVMALMQTKNYGDWTKYMNDNEEALKEGLGISSGMNLWAKTKIVGNMLIMKGLGFELEKEGQDDEKAMAEWMTTNRSVYLADAYGKIELATNLLLTEKGVVIVYSNNVITFTVDGKIDGIDYYFVAKYRKV